MVELIVALTLLAVAVLGLTAAALAAHRAFVTADALQRAGSAAAAVIDSLTQLPRVAGGERAIPSGVVRWQTRATADSLTAIDVTVELEDGAARRMLTFHALHADAR